MGQEFKSLFLNTIQKELRSKTLYMLTGFTVLLVIMVNVFMNFINTNILDANATQFIGDQTANVVFLMVDFWSTFLCILFGINTIKSDVSSGAIGQVLSFPIKRRTYLAARILGSCLIVFFYYAFSMSLAILLFSITSDKQIGSMGVLYALAPSLLNIFIIILLSVNFSMFLPRMMSFIFMSFLTFFIVLSNKAFMAKEISAYFQDLGAMKSLGLVFHLIFPRIGVVSAEVGSILFGTKVDFSYMMEIPHLVIALGLWILVTIGLFNKEDY